MEEEENKHNSILDAQIQNIIKKEDDKLKSGFKRMNDGVQNDSIQQLYAATKTFLIFQIRLEGPVQQEAKIKDQYSRQNRGHA